jgi:hypothetical protein
MTRFPGIVSLGLVALLLVGCASHQAPASANGHVPDSDDEIGSTVGNIWYVPGRGLICGLGAVSAGLILTLTLGIPMRRLPKSCTVAAADHGSLAQWISGNLSHSRGVAASRGFRRGSLDDPRSIDYAVLHFMISRDELPGALRFRRNNPYRITLS